MLLAAPEAKVIGTLEFPDIPPPVFLVNGNTVSCLNLLPKSPTSGRDPGERAVDSDFSSAHGYPGGLTRSIKLKKVPSETI